MQVFIRENSSVAPAHLPDDELLHLLLDSVTDYAIFSLDPIGRISSWNAGAQKLKGYTADEIIGRHVSIFYPDQDGQAKAATLLKRALDQGRVEDEDWRVRKDSSKFWASVIISPMFDSAGELKGFAKVTRDLTERKQAEENRIRLAQLQEAARIRDEFLAYVSHEMRTPLASVQLQLELLRNARAELTQETAGKVLGRLERAYGRLADLVNSVLRQSQIQAGRMLPRLAPVNLAHTLVEIVDEFRPEAERKGLELVFKSELGQATFNTDGDFVRIILVNLISNAIKFTNSGTIEVSLSCNRVEYQIRVRDQGVGIALEHQRRIFEPFERVESVEHKHTPGFGLGLATSKKLSEALGARIELRSQLGLGSSFTLVLPPESTA